MTDSAAEFGSPARFHIRLQWLSVREPAGRLPASHGWSMGRLALTVANRNLMAHSVGIHRQDDLCWFLGPLLHWFADNWIALFHEEHFTWREHSSEAAAAACEQAMASPAGEGSFEAAQQWYFRHAIAAAAVGGLFPDIVLRRFSDDIEISWTGVSSPFAPDGFVFVSEPGRVYLPVSDVALPLWEMLRWTRDNPPVLDDDTFEADYRDLTAKIERLSALETNQYQRADMPEALFGRVQSVFADVNRRELLDPVRHDWAPFVVSRSPAMAMFGGMDVDISEADVTALRDLLVRATDGAADSLLQDLVENAALVGKPWQNGYQLADSLLDELEDSGFDVFSGDHVSIGSLCRRFGIEVTDLELETDSVRGVALAGEELKPVIVVNTNSIYNRKENSRRFTVAHELCHILHDQGRARRLAHISGPWASPAIEQRANAFAAWLLMPRRLLMESFAESGDLEEIEHVRRLVERIRVTDIALIWHLYNLGFIQDSQRESLLSDIGLDRNTGHVTRRDT